ncbi:MAG TPA: siderophore-interacting protein [Acidimicrobiales bacterium]
MTAGSARRPPPPFLVAEVVGRDWLTPRLVRVTLEGEPLTSLEVTQPASSVRVLLPDPERPHDLELPSWDGNRFELSGGSRPVLRTLTPRHHESGGRLLKLDVVVHGDGAAARWASDAADGSPAAVSGPARGYSIDAEAETLVLGGDETATAAISQILEAATDVDVAVYLEIADAGSRPRLPDHPRCAIHWVDQEGKVPGAALADRLADVDLPGGARLWAAGEAASMQRLRQRLFNDRGVPRAHATIRGYWKHGRSGEDEGGG